LGKTQPIDLATEKNIMTTHLTASAIRPLTPEEIDLIEGGEITVINDPDYFGIEISVGKWSVAVWFTQGSACGQVKTPGGIHGGCT
jgi:hypothetical protein